MKYWVQYLDLEGNDSDVHRLDGRISQQAMHYEALAYAQRCAHWRRFSAYQLVSGPAFKQEARRLPATPLTYPVPV